MEDDEDLQRAIQLSLAELAPSNPIIIDSDEDLRAAIEASKAEAQVNNAILARIPTPPPAHHTPLPTTAIATSSFIAERAVLEAERLERQKRKLSQVNDETVQTSSSMKRQRSSNSGSDSWSPPTESPEPRTIKSTPIATTYSTSEAMFFQGVTRPIANAHVDPTKDTMPSFRLSEIISSKSDVSFAIVSSYCENLPWLYEFFDPKTPVIFVGQTGADGNASIKNVLPNWIRVTPYLRGGRGCMHVKLALLFYKSGRLRIVIPTANFVAYDWRDIENAVWLQDIPRRQTPLDKTDSKAANFPSTLQRMLKALNVTPALRLHLKGDHPNLPLQSIDELATRWDWSSVKVSLVGSMAGKHEGWGDVNRTGHTQLANAICEVGARAGKHREVEIEYQESPGSSIGSYSTQWMNEFHCSGRGDSARTWLNEPRTKRSKLPYPPVKVIFPTLETVKKTKLGITGGSTLFCRRSQWQAQKFPRDLFFDSRSKRGGVLMHTKMMIALFRNKTSSTSEQGPENGVDHSKAGWAYIGSHNFSPSAWGTLSGSALTPVLNVTNFELGVVLPLRSEKEADDLACWERPPRKYDLKCDVPWMQDEVLGPLKEAMRDAGD